MAKNSLGLIALVVIVFLLITSTSQTGFQIPKIKNPFDFLYEDTSNTVPVMKPLEIHLVDKYGGGPIASKSNTFQLYDSDGKTILEDNEDTDADGHLTTGSPYPSGKQMYLRYESSNDKQWWSFTVPEMNEKDAESATNNMFRLDSFTIGTYTTDALKLANGTSLSDAGTYDVSASGSTITMTYSLANTGNDNTGLMASRDPLYGQNWDVELYITFSGTGYEKLIIHSLNYDFTLGSTHYVGKTLDPYKLTKHKQGLDFKSLGTLDTTFWIDASGLTGANDSVTMQIETKAYADHTYGEAHGGNFGTEAVEIAEHTLTIED